MAIVDFPEPDGPTTVSYTHLEILDVPIYEGCTDFPQCHDIELRNVRFSYDGKTDVLQGVNLKIRDGERLALVISNNYYY